MFELGNSLREARTRRGIEFAQAEQATKIRGKYLRALEDEQFDMLPSETYVKGFLRTYAEYLGLDGQLYVDEFNSRFVAGDEWEPRASRARSVHREDRRLGAKVVLFAVAVIAVLTTIVISAWKTSGSGDEGRHNQQAPVVHRRAAPVAYLQLTAARGPSKVIVNRGSVSGRILFEGTLERGETEAFTGKRFWLNVGAPENLVITVAGKQVHVAGGRPWVLTVTPSGWHGHPA